MDEIISHNHDVNSGVFNRHLLNPDYSPQIITDLRTGGQLVLDGNGQVDHSVQVWTIPRDMEIPVQDTLYWTTMHKSPRLNKKTQVIGFQVRFHIDDTVTKHLVDVIVSKCRVPRGSNTSPAQMFERFTHGKGVDYLRFGLQPDPMPIPYCNEIRHVWRIGGPTHFHPPGIGIPLESEEYYTVLLIMDNINLLENARVSISLDLFYTSNIGAHNGGIISVRHNVPGLSPSVLIPPHTTNHHMLTICGVKCTHDMILEQGITLYGGLVHTHSIGTATRVRHFRGSQELPYIDIDNNFSPLYQPVRNFREERTSW